LAGQPERAVTNDQLTALMAERVMDWRVGPERILKGGRRWAPRWHFQPLRRLEHALELLEKAEGKYRLEKDRAGTFNAQVTVGDRSGTASGKSEAVSLTLALARALGIDVEGLE
jgi:hypothetical protein